jgi:flagellin
MGLRIQTNIQSVNAQRNLVGASEVNAQSMERLASGFRINRASDDAAGLAISEKLKADIRGLNMAKRNASDGISLVQTAEGAMSEVGNILARLRELSVQGASDTIGQTERGFLNKEFMQLKDEIDRITSSTEYNGTMLLVGDQSKAPEALAARSNKYPLEIQVHKNWYAETDGEGARNPTNTIRIDFSTINTGTGESGLAIGSAGEDGGARVDSKASAQASIDMVDKAISKVASYRSDLGAVQSRLSSTINNLAIASENFSAANSRIRDTDFAEETARMTQSNIIKQGGVAVLSQANAAPQAALRLLG